MSIVFQRDWKDDNGNLRAIPHLTTKNLSFLRTAQLLRKMNVSNYAFMLALYDPDLLNVDVYDLEEDTPENEILRVKVMKEARFNVWYFLRECIKIYEQGGTPIPFRLDRGSCSMTWCFINGIDFCSMLPRQCGKPQPLYSLILTPKGWVRMGDILPNDKVVSPDGTISRVIGVYPQGIKDVYRITLKDGRKTECGLEHLWKVYGDRHGGEAQILTLEALKELHDHPFHTGNLYIPIANRPNSDERQPIASIDYVGKEETQCIEIDHPDHLYITDDFIVTHNTVCALSLSSWVLYASGYQFEIGMFAKGDSLRRENVKRVKGFGENLPHWWIVKSRDKDKINAEEIYYAELKTHYTTFVAQKEKAAADKQARGVSPAMLHWDEFEFTSNVGISYPIALASTGTARENSKKNGKPHSNIITTTAGDPTMPECKEAMEILNGAMPFSEHLYDIETYEKLHEVVEAASPQKMIIAVFSHLQLGRDNKWLREKIQRNRMTREQVMRDYLNRRVSIADKPIIDKEVLATINSSQQDVQYIQFLHEGFVIYWYLSKDVVTSAAFRERSIVVGCDSSEMINRDATTLVGIDPSTLETVCTFRTAVGNINVVGSMIGKLLLLFPKMVWVPENKSSGTSLIDIVSMVLRESGHNPFLRIYNRVIQERSEQEFAKIDIRDTSLLDTSVKRYFGIKTDKAKRDQLYSETLMEAAAKAASRVKDQTLIQELNTLTLRNNRVDHAAGGHDDTCFIGSTLIRTNRGNRPLSELKVGDLVMTREGYKPILHIFCREKEVITKFNMTGTPDHPFITPKGIVPFEDLTIDSKVYVWNEKLSSITERTITEILTVDGRNTSGIFTVTTKTILLPLRYIVKSGKTIKALFPRGWKFITKMKTILTTPSKISNVSRPLNIEENILFPKKSSKRTPLERKKKIVSDNGDKKTPLPPENMLAIMEKRVQAWQIGEETIRRQLESSTEKQDGKARKPGELRKEIVYNLHVAECNEYFVNDILVHNCVAWLMAMWFVFHGRHLDLYGIKPGTALSYINPGQPSKSKLSEEHQLKVRAKVEELEKMLKLQRDPSIRRLIESDLILVRSMINHNDLPTPTTADEFTRNPQRFIDQKIAQESRPPIHADDVSRSLKMMLGL